MKKQTSGDERRRQRFVRRTSARRDRENVERALGTRTKMEHRCVMSPKKRKMFMAAVSERRRRDASSDLGWSTRRPGRAETSRARAREAVCEEREERDPLAQKLPGAPIPDEFRIWNSAHISPRCRSRRITNPENPQVDYIPVLSDCACCTRTGVRRRSSDERTRVPRSHASQSWSRKQPSWRS